MAEVQLNTDEVFEEIFLESPLMPEKFLSNCKFQDAQQLIMQDVAKMHESNFYEYIKIHYGVRSRREAHYLEEKYKRQKEILHYKILEEQDYINQLQKAESEEQLTALNQKYAQNLNLIKERQQEVSHYEFRPKIFIEAKKKMPVYGKIVQEFDRKGFAMIRATLGYRGPAGMFDRVEFNMESPSINYIKKRNMYQFGINWTYPLKQSLQRYVGAQYLCYPSFRDIDEKKKLIQVGVSDGKSRSEFQFGYRFPQIHTNFSEYASENYYEPSRKLSYKFDKTFIDTLKKGEVDTGRYCELKTEFTVPLLSQTNFIKLQYNHKEFYDLYRFGSWFENESIKKMFRYCNLETNHNLQMLISRKNYVSDLLDNIELRGFDDDKKPHRSFINWKNSIKFNIYNYPGLGKVGVVPFFYAQLGLSIPPYSYQNLYTCGSSGFGFSYPLAKMINLEILYPFLQMQNKPSRHLSTLQFRISVND